MQRPVSSSADGSSIVYFLFLAVIALIVLFYLVLGLIVATVATWPWCLLMFPTVGGIVLAARPRLRSNIIPSFRKGTSRPEALELRHGLIVASLVATVLVGGLCAFFAGRGAVQWWLVPLGFLTACLRLCELNAEEAKGRFLKTFLKNIVEFCLTVSSVSLVYCIVLIFIVPHAPESILLEKLRTFQQYVEFIHEWLEDHKPQWKTLVSVAATLWIARIVFTSRTWKRVTEAASEITARLLNTFSIVSTAFVVAASLTFLATATDGPLVSLGITLRQAGEKYNELRGTVGITVDRVLREEIVNQAIAQKPPIAKEEEDLALALRKQQKEYVQVSEEARRRFRLATEGEETIVRPPKPAQPTSTRNETPRTPDGAWTLTSLEKASAEATNASKEAQEKDKEDPLDDTSSEALKEATIERVAEGSLLVETIKKWNPIVGEAIDVISDSVSESVFSVLKERIVSEVLRQRSQNPGQPLLALVRAVTHSQVASINFKWEPVAKIWSAFERDRLKAEIADLATKRAALEKEAQLTSDDLFEGDVVDATQRVKLLENIADKLGDEELKQGAGVAKEELQQISTAGRNWPALTPPSPEQISTLEKATEGQKVHSSDPLRELPAGTVPAVVSVPPLYGWELNHTFRYVASSILWGTTNPGVDIKSLSEYIDDLLTALIARRQKDGGDTAQLKKVMGDEFDRYKSALDQRIAKGVRAAQDAQAAKERVEAQRAYEERRREEARRQKEHFEETYRETHTERMERAIR